MKMEMDVVILSGLEWDPVPFVSGIGTKTGKESVETELLNGLLVKDCVRCE